MTTQDVANRLFEMVSAGDFEGPYGELYSPNIVSVEATPGEMKVCTGMDQVMAKGQWWEANFEVMGCDCDGPFVCDDQFAVRYSMKVKSRAGGDAFEMNEVAVYSVEDGKIVHEKFFGRD